MRRAPRSLPDPVRPALSYPVLTNVTFSSCWARLLKRLYDPRAGQNPWFWNLLFEVSLGKLGTLVPGAQCLLIGGGQHGAIPWGPGRPKAIWGQFRRKKFRASEDLVTQNPDPTERNTTLEF